MSRIFVRNIPTRTKQSEIEDLFKKIGKITDIVLKQNFAFIQYSHEHEAVQAVNKFNDFNMNGNKILVELAKTRTEKLAERMNEKCFKCGEYGHWAKDCKLFKYKAKEEKRKFKRVRRSPKRSFSRSMSYDSYESKSGSRSVSRQRSRSRSQSRSKLK
jgi:arginine/serine-rich splicing factor 7